MKNFAKKILPFATILIMLFSAAQTIYALGEYAPLVPLPCTTVLRADGTPDCTQTGQTTNFKTYLPGLVNWSMGVAAVMAFATITFGGILYATSDSIAGTSKGREYVENAIWGLLLVISAWIILNTINPQILNFDLSIPRVNIASTTAEGAGGAAPGIATDLGPSITVKDSTVNLTGLQQSTIDGIKNMQVSCGCNIVISSGVEGDHSQTGGHYSGNALDILPNAALNNTVDNGVTPTACQKFSPSSGGTYMWEPKDEYCGGPVKSNGDHWHASYP